MLGPVPVIDVGWAEPDVSIPAMGFRGLLDAASIDLQAARDRDPMGYYAGLPMTTHSSLLADTSNVVRTNGAATGGAASRSGAAHGSIKASVATVELVIGPSAAPLLKKPPVLTEEQRRRLEEALARSHRPGPPLPVEPGSDPEAAVPSEPATEARAPGAEAEAIPRLAPENFQIFRNEDLGEGAPAEYTSLVNEPSVAQNGEVVFYTGNWYGALSTDGGRSFGFIDPFTGPFPPVNNGFCCDQVTLYDPSHNAIFWLQQYIEDSTSGTQRINVDVGADGSFDCHYDFTPQNLGEPPGRSYDFPDLVLGANYLYHTSNIGSFGSPFVTRAMISRYPLEQIATCGSLQQYFYFVTTDRVSMRPTHGAGTTMYWGAHNSTSSMRIYSWDEGSVTISWDDRTVGTWANGGGTCPVPTARIGAAGRTGES